MPKDDRDVLEILKAELDFVENGGYGRSVRTPWKPTSVFEDSLTCINLGDPNRSRPCEECPLMEFVPPACRLNNVPCHQIPITATGETITSLESAGQDTLEEAVRNWLRTNISSIEATRARLGSSLKHSPPKPLPPASDRKRLLVVDDDELLLIQLERLLVDAGFDTATAWSGQEALRLLRPGRFDFVLLDDYLPGITTEEVLRQLQRMPDRTPIVIMQGANLADELAARYARLGACYFISKRQPREIVERAKEFVGHCELLPA